MRRAGAFAVVIAAIVFGPVGSPKANAQEGIEYLDHGGVDLSVTAGTLLPFGIVGVRDTYPMWGMRVSHPSQVARLEYGIVNAQAKGVTYYNGSFGLRIDYRMARVFDGFFGIGADVHYYKRKRTASREFPFYRAGGGHFDFGAIWDLTPKLGLRADFKMNFNPGRSLFVGFGLIYRFGGGALTQGEAP